MSGLTSLLNIAKTAILTEQLNLQTTGHNIANVNTDGYSRQNVTSKPAYPTPSPVGPIGNGVNASEITRYFDRFVTTTLFDKTSTMSGLNTQQSGMKLIEGVLNEVDANGWNGLLDNFWNAWDDVANNAEGTSERTALLQQASLLSQGLKDRYDSMVKLSQDVDVNIQSTVENINQIADQISQLNVQILSMEVGNKQANDLRDQRDQLVKNLSQLTDVRYFETQQGTYTVLIGAGNPLVEGNKSWHLDVQSGSVVWLSSNGGSVRLTTQDIAAGELGGWMDIKSRVTPRDTSLLIGSSVLTTSGKEVRAATQWDPVAGQSVPLAGGTRWDALDGVTVSGDFGITISGTDENGLPVNGTFSYTQGPPESNATVADFLTFIENTFRGSGTQRNVEASITDDGRIQIKDLTPGSQPITFQIADVSGNVSGLNLGKFDGSYPLNYLEQLNRVGQELIKAVNSQFSQGVGLVPLQETTGIYTATNTGEPLGRQSSGLAFSGDIQDGAFEIWLYDKNGNVIDADPTTAEVNDPILVPIMSGSTTMEDVQKAIDAVDGLSSRILNGRLVIQADGANGVAGFAFGRDTSNALLTLGLNAFFTGQDAGTIGINPVYANDVRLIAAAQVEPRGTDSVTSTTPVQDSARPLGVNVQSGSFAIQVYDTQGNMVDLDPNTDGVNPLYVNVDPATTSVEDITDAINAVDGLHAEIAGDRLHVWADNPQWSGFSFGGDTSGTLQYLGVDAGHVGSLTQTIESRESVTDPAAAMGSVTSGLQGYGALRDGSFEVRRYDDAGHLIATSSINVDASATSLNDLQTALDALPGVSATIQSTVVGGQTYYRLEVAPSNAGETVAFAEDTSNLLGTLGVGEVSQELQGAYQLDRTAEGLDTFNLGVTDGAFNVYLFDADGYALAPTLTGSMANTEPNAAPPPASVPITAATTWDSIDGLNLTGPGAAPYPFTITFSGKDQSGNLVNATYTANDPSTDTVGDFLTSIQTAFGGDVTATIDANGQLVVASTDPAAPVAFRVDDIRTVNSADTISGLSFGTFSGSYAIDVSAGHDGLQDVAARIDALSGLKSWVANDRLEIQAEGNVAKFVLADDTSGLLQAVDLQTPAGGTMSPANNQNAVAMRDVSRQSVEALDGATVNEAYQSLVGTVGIQSQGVQLDYAFSQASVNDLQTQRDSVSAVSLDEELANLIKFQQAYVAAAKLLNVADELFTSLLQTK